MEFDNNIDIRHWVDDDKFSDLTIKLSDGSELSAHKIIVCARNDYFLKLCGPDSHFAVSLTNIHLGSNG
jgi:hypothetical protein